MIKLYLVGQKVFVWNAEDVMKLRKEYRIVGSLIGTCPKKYRRRKWKKRKYLPLLLMPEEATLLVEKGIASLHLSPEKIENPNYIEAYLSKREELLEEQAILKKEKRKKIILEKADEIYAGKKRKLMEKEAKKRAISKKNSEEKAVHNEDKSDIDMVTETTKKTTEEPALTVRSEKEHIIRENSSDSVLHCETNVISDDCEEMDVCDSIKIKKDEEIYSESKSNLDEKDSGEKLNTSSKTNEKIALEEGSSSKDSEQAAIPILDKEAVIAEVIAKIPDVKREKCRVQIFTECPFKINPAVGKLNYPLTDTEKLHYAIFKDLWEKKYFITSGMKFGGDFLAYSGDPIKFHSEFIVTCLPDFKKFKSLDIITHGRIAGQVKKTALMASIDKSKTAEYVKIYWAGDDE